jgi:hypothetical protein
VRHHRIHAHQRQEHHVLHPGSLSLADEWPEVALGVGDRWRSHPENLADARQRVREGLRPLKVQGAALRGATEAGRVHSPGHHLRAPARQQPHQRAANSPRRPCHQHSPSAGQGNATPPPGGPPPVISRLPRHASGAIANPNGSAGNGRELLPRRFGSLLAGAPCGPGRLAIGFAVRCPFAGHVWDGFRSVRRELWHRVGLGNTIRGGDLRSSVAAWGGKAAT